MLTSHCLLLRRVVHSPMWSPWNTISRILLEILRGQHVRLELFSTSIGEPTWEWSQHREMQRRPRWVELCHLLPVSLCIWVLCNTNDTRFHVHLFMLFPLLAMLFPLLYCPQAEWTTSCSHSRTNLSYADLALTTLYYCSLCISSPLSKEDLPEGRLLLFIFVSLALSIIIDV